MYQGRREEKKRENKVVARARISPTENMLGQGLLLDGAGSMLLGLFQCLLPGITTNSSKIPKQGDYVQ